MYQKVTGDSLRNLLDASQVWEAFADAVSLLETRYRGNLRWRNINGKEYLYRIFDSRTEKSLGPRSEETEAIFAAFQKGKQETEERKNGLQEKVAWFARVLKASRLGQCTTVAGKILRRLDQLALQDKTFTVVGTHSLYAYESMAAIRFASDLRSTGDLDLLWDTKSRLRLAGQIPPEGLFGVLQKADKSFAVLSQAPFRAVNKEGFLVDLLREPGNPFFGKSPRSITKDDTFVSVEARGQEWLLSSPKVRTIIFDEQGIPAPIVAVDPRAYALHKFWLSSRLDRDPAKKQRDLQQSKALLEVIEKELALPWDAGLLRQFPESVQEAFVSFQKANDPWMQSPDDNQIECQSDKDEPSGSSEEPDWW